MDHADAVQCPGFAGWVSSNSPQRERLIEIVERFSVLTKRIVGMSSVVQQCCLEARIGQGFRKREGQGIGIQRLLGLVQTRVDFADVIECESFAGRVTPGAPQRERLGMVIQRLPGLAQRSNDKPRLVSVAASGNRSFSVCLSVSAWPRYSNAFCESP